MQPREIYTSKDIQTTGGGVAFLEVVLAQNSLMLPMQRVAASDRELLLAWVDPKRDDITEAGSQALAEILIELQPALVISPFSSKSIPMAAAAVDFFNQTRKEKAELLVLSGGKNEDQIRESIGEEGIILPYNPITSSLQEKFVGISKEHAEQIANHIIHGDLVALVDDVYGTGATINAVRAVIGLATDLEIPKTMLPAVVVAREIEGDYEAQRLDHVFASIILPAIVTANF